MVCCCLSLLFMFIVLNVFFEIRKIISGQCLHFITLKIRESQGFSHVFRVYKMGVLGRIMVKNSPQKCACDVEAIPADSVDLTVNTCLQSTIKIRDKGSWTFLK